MIEVAPFGRLPAPRESSTPGPGPAHTGPAIPAAGTPSGRSPAASRTPGRSTTAARWRPGRRRSARGLGVDRAEPGQLARPIIQPEQRRRGHRHPDGWPAPTPPAGPPAGPIARPTVGVTPSRRRRRDKCVHRAKHRHRVLSGHPAGQLRHPVTTRLHPQEPLLPRLAMPLDIRLRIHPGHRPQQAAAQLRHRLLPARRNTRSSTPANVSVSVRFAVNSASAFAFPRSIRPARNAAAVPGSRSANCTASDSLISAARRVTRNRAAISSGANSLTRGPSSGAYGPGRRRANSATNSACRACAHPINRSQPATPSNKSWLDKPPGTARSNTAAINGPGARPQPASSDRNTRGTSSPEVLDSVVGTRPYMPAGRYTPEANRRHRTLSTNSWARPSSRSWRAKNSSAASVAGQSPGSSSAGSPGSRYGSRRHAFSVCM